MLLSGFFFFGIVFDDRLSWNEKIKQLISKAGKRVGMLGRLRRSLTRESANIIYCSLIRPVLEYCVSVWGCFGERHKERRRKSVFKFVKKCL